MIGYSSGTYFSAVFKKITGINPQDYKGEANEEQDTARN
jgi:YesN/AraC family two-component response regulator